MEVLNLKRGYGFLIKSEISRKYFSGVDIAEGYVLLCDSPVYFTDARYFYSAKEKIKPPYRAKLYKGLTSIKEELTALNIKTLYIDYDDTTLTEFNGYKAFNVKLLDGSSLIKEKMEIKSEKELKNIIKACKITQNAYEKAIKKVKSGMTENALKSIIEKNMIDLGAEKPSFSTIVAFGKNSAVPHHETGETKLVKGDVILVDVGCVVNGYCSDMTRTCVYKTASEKIIKTYQAVLKANLKAEKEIKPKMQLKDCDNIARECLKEEGLDKYFTHSLGHGVGLKIHESPTLSIRAKGIIKEGTVFTVEPGVYFDGEFGIRIEDTVVMRKGKVLRLFKDDKKLKIL